MANLYGLTSILLAFTAGILILLMTQATPTSAVTYQSQYRYVRTRYRSYYYRCRYYYYTYCYRWYYYRCWYRWYYWPRRYYCGCRYYNPWYGWGYWPYCYRRRSRCCYRRYYWRYYNRRLCKTGWRGSRCNIPVCTETCGAGRVCLYDGTRNYCGCQKQGTSNACEILPCSRQNNCYPGTCKSNRCDCPSGFNGTNCERINHQPAIGDCSVKLYAKRTPSSAETVVGEATCAADGVDPLTVFVGAGLDFSRDDKGITKLEVNWKAEYDDPLPMPSRPSGANFFVSNAPVQIGISGGSFTISFDGYTSRPDYCRGLSAASPVTATTDQCVLLPTWSSLGVNSKLIHNSTMTITVSNRLGGQKIGDSTYSYGTTNYGFSAQTFTGDDATKQAQFQFDLERPTHCLLENNLADVIDRSANCTVFPIALDEDITTNQTIYPSFLGWSDNESGLDRFEVAVYLLQPGTSGTLVQLADPEDTATVQPDQNNYHFSPRQPGVYAIVVTVYDETGNKARARKIFNFHDQSTATGFKDTKVPVHFISPHTGRPVPFITADRDGNATLSWAGRFVSKNSSLTGSVEPWPIDENTIDDVYGTTFGLRSISAITGVVGITSISCTYSIKSTGTGGPEGGAEGPEDDVRRNCTIDPEAETAILDFSDSPVTSGDIVTVWLNVSGHDDAKATVKKSATVDLSRPDVTVQEFVANRDDKHFSYVEITVEDRESGIDSITWRIVDRKNNDVVVLEGAAVIKTRFAPGTKRRKRNTAPEQACTPDDTTCYCIPHRDMCFAHKQEVVIDHCDIDRFKGDEHQLYFIYNVTNLAGENAQNQFLLDIGKVVCRPAGGFPAGVIAAIIIGLLLLILLIIIIVLMLLRVRQKKHPVPQRFRTMAEHARKRLTLHKDAAEDNELYMAGEQPPAYPGQPRQQPQNHHDNPAVDTDSMYMDSNGLTPGRIPRNQLQMTSVLAEGRFAVIRKAQLDSGKERSVVAAKALRNGFSKSDEVLMGKKAEFLREVPPHLNVVRFIGELEDTGGEGPIMVLELCDEPLKDWLSSRSSLNTDDLEALLGFALNIARGVQHLHSHKILHRRLGVRNVLLQKQANGLVAKLIGFGPLAEDMDSASDKSTTGSAAPIKWLAPETLDTLNSKKPKYDEKTDAWSYGITMWEMYSKGAAPFSEVRSTDVKAHIKRGNRMTCPRDCPPELFDTVVYPCWNEKASKRPSFAAICQSIDEFRYGGSTQTGYYGRDEVGEDTDNQIYDDGR